MQPVTADEAFYAMTRAMTIMASGWGVRAKVHALRERLGISEERHVAITKELAEDPRVQNLKEGHHPSAKRARPPPPAPPPAPVAGLPPLPHAGSHKSERLKGRARGSDQGAVELGIAGRRDRVNVHDPFSLVGHLIDIQQEDDSMVRVTVTAYDTATNMHHVVMDYGGPGASSPQEVPLWDNPESYTIVGEDPNWQFPSSAPARAGGGGSSSGAARTAPKSGMKRAPAPGSSSRGGAARGGGGGARSGTGGGGGIPAVGGKQPPYEDSWLQGKLESATLQELGLMLVAVAKKEAQVHGQLSHSGFAVAELQQQVQTSIQQRLEASQQLAQLAKTPLAT